MLGVTSAHTLLLALRVLALSNEHADTREQRDREMRAPQCATSPLTVQSEAGGGIRPAMAFF